jgi:hypothetical protein
MSKCSDLTGLLPACQRQFRRKNLSGLRWNRTVTSMKRFVLLLLLLFSLPACGQQNDRSAPLPGERATDVLKLIVAESNVYRLSLDDLQEAGLALADLNAERLHLSSEGTAVPYLIHDNALIFYGQAPSDRYTAVRPYLLHLDQEPGLLMEQAALDESSSGQTAVQTSRHFEENHKYLAETRRDDDADLWYWATIGQGRALSLTLDLPTVLAQPATIRLQLWGTTTSAAIDNDHDFDLIINGTTIDTIRWDGQVAYLAETAVPAGVLQSGPNEIILDNSVPGAAPLDIMELNWIEISYAAPATAHEDRLLFYPQAEAYQLDGFTGSPLLFDLSDPDRPRWLTADNATHFGFSQETPAHLAAIGPHGFAQPERLEPLRQSNWADTDQQADLVILTTDSLIPALAPLVAARQEQGLNVVVVPVAEVYDAFGYGAPTPAAVQTFIRHAYENWQPPHPRYLFIVGSATADYRDYLGQAPANIVPSPMVPVQYSGETVSDSRLVDVTGDTRPDLAVGRWPISSVAEVENLVERTLAYEAGTAVDQALFATDASEAQFATMAGRLWEQSGQEPATMTLLNGIEAEEVAARWNEGVWLATYIGHGSLERWGRQNIFNLEAVSRLRPANPPIVLQLTCLTGLFAHPTQPSLAEVMLTNRYGPVLTVAATSLTLSSHQEPFAHSLVQHLLDPEVERIGDAFQKAKLSLDVAGSDGLREVSDTFVLLGDPSARIVRPLAR